MAGGAGWKFEGGGGKVCCRRKICIAPADFFKISTILHLTAPFVATVAVAVGGVGVVSRANYSTVIRASLLFPVFFFENCSYPLTLLRRTLPPPHRAARQLHAGCLIPIVQATNPMEL